MKVLDGPAKGSFKLLLRWKRPSKRVAYNQTARPVRWGRLAEGLDNGFAQRYASGLQTAGCDAGLFMLIQPACLHGDSTIHREVWRNIPVRFVDDDTNTQVLQVLWTMRSAGFMLSIVRLLTPILSRW
jgi:hypothetical protein